MSAPGSPTTSMPSSTPTGFIVNADGELCFDSSIYPVPKDDKTSKKREEGTATPADWEEILKGLRSRSVKVTVIQHGKATATHRLAKFVVPTGATVDDMATWKVYNPFLSGWTLLAELQTIKDNAEWIQVLEGAGESLIATSTDHIIDSGRSCHWHIPVGGAD